MYDNQKTQKPITSFKALIVYQNSYEAMLIIMKEVLPLLPECEKFDLKDQLSRSCKAIPRLIAEGYAKRQQKAGFRKYIEDAMAECNETVVSLMQARDIYNIQPELLNRLIGIYDVTGRQLYSLGEKWKTFNR
ncbi:MAG: four helix bundle protein [Bacteroidota bacterium]